MERLSQVFATYIGAQWIGFTGYESGAIAIIGGADGPTSIFLANALAPELLAPIAVRPQLYGLVPVIQPPVMRAPTTQKERRIRMHSHAK